ncbi:histidine phosphatase family protein [Anaerobacillus alkaliphilus]|uniref:Histidine phosphatase family protein n=2 Tax=Anaerobacillus alkaliphilus TaxID=1548597 RepID=A0A4Q0VMZ8_9BACI|nr:histidine phosphatase family protein [Anaerobacillus alkaliphilus]
MLHTRTQVARTNRSLLASLKEGGYIFYTRHAEAIVGADQPNLNFQDCSTQRNLSLIGRRQATEYGETIRRLAIPIMAPVASSPFCRNIETAALAFGREYIQVDPFLYDVYRLSTNISPFDQQRILATLNSVLETPVPAGTNKVIIAHSFPVGIGLGRLPNMGTIIVRPRGYGMGFEVVAYLTLAELNRLT